MQKNAPIAGLDFLRFLAATLVMSWHLGVASWALPDLPDFFATQIVAGAVKYPEFFNFASGFVGVEIFFVISGVVITYSAATSSPYTFLRNRMLRLYPTVWICATLSTITLWGYGMESGRKLIHHYINSVLLLPFGPWVDAVYWTLGIEMSFYALIFGLLVVGAFGRIMVVCSVIGSVSAAYWIGSLVIPSLPIQNWWLDLSLVNHGIYFALGILLYSVRTSGASLVKIGFSVILLVAAVIEISYKNYNHIILLNAPFSAILPISIFFIALGIAAMSIYWNVRPGTAHALRFVGLATYPLYLIHDYCGAAVLQMIGGHSEINRFFALGLTFIVCITASLLIAGIAEPPIRRGFGAVLEIVWLRLNWLASAELINWTILNQRIGGFRPALLRHNRSRLRL